jgi:dTDP-4-dehydrorhamnose 3,5-epimerase
MPEAKAPSTLVLPGDSRPGKNLAFHPTPLHGVFEVRPQFKSDERGFFARTWCRQEFEDAGLDPALVQCSISFNRRKGTLRGMHYQAAPYAESKLVRCTMGAIYDVILDLRIESPTFKQWTALVLAATNRHMAYVPEGCAHGFLTLEDDTEVFYQMSEFYDAESARGIRWNDPAFRIDWPVPVEVLSERDRTYANFE